MIVVVSNEAKTDLLRIGDHIAQDNPRRAKTFVFELIGKCRGLGRFPFRFSLMPDYEHRGVRRRPHGAYLIFYRVGANRDDVLRVLNAAQNYERILFPDD